jgi:hypothetical protein
VKDELFETSILYPVAFAAALQFAVKLVHPMDDALLAEGVFGNGKVGLVMVPEYPLVPQAFTARTR